MKTLLYIIFYSPLIIYNLISLLLPFNKNGYKPSNEPVRLSEEALRNKARLAFYKAKFKK